MELLAVLFCISFEPEICRVIDSPAAKGVLSNPAGQRAGESTIREPVYLSIPVTVRVWTRVMDVVIAAIGLVMAAPLFALVAILIKTESSGPVFYSQLRVGLHRKRFWMLKFRKMRNDLAVQGPSITRRHDTRMTLVGVFLERTKLDELPQLVNVLKGEMSIVGPRPELPKFVEVHPEMWDEVLSVKPGIFGPNQLTNRNESELFPRECKDVEAFYIQELLPGKLRVDAAFARQNGFWLYLSLLVRCLVVSLVGSITLETLAVRRWQIINTLLLTFMGATGMILANLVTHEITNFYLASLTILVAATVKLICLLVFRVPKALATSMTADDFLTLCWCSAASSALLVCILMFTDNRGVGRMLLLIDWAFFTSTLLIYKLLLYRFYITFVVQRSRYLTAQLIRACLVVAPCSMFLAMTLRRGPGIWIEGLPFLECVIVLLATIVRPLILLIRPLRVEASSTQWLLNEWRRLMAGTIIGSCFIVCMTVLLNRRDMSRTEMILDGFFFLGMMTIVAIRQNTKAVLAQKARDAAVGNGPKNRLLIVGEGLELSAYISALAAIPEQQFEIVGIVTPHRWHRTNMVGDYAVLGVLQDIPDIVRDHSVNRILALESTANCGDLRNLDWDEVAVPQIEQIEFLRFFAV
jgi:lipopolysaccharide/colanic/teichoic acid biosynthesis glycosyltransferase